MGHLKHWDEFQAKAKLLGQAKRLSPRLPVSLGSRRVSVFKTIMYACIVGTHNQASYRFGLICRKSNARADMLTVMLTC